MNSTSDKPTALAKLLGFYTVEIKNLESGAMQAKADLLVMENLFYDQKIAKTFDLKGIQTRKAKAGTAAGPESSMPKTMYDSDWIEGAVVGVWDYARCADLCVSVSNRPAARDVARPPAFKGRVPGGYQE
jgi:1-phosphatidylinositol-3-phosphate 5-kinase